MMVMVVMMIVFMVLASDYCDGEDVDGSSDGDSDGGGCVVLVS